MQVPYLPFFEGMARRLAGPLGFRFILQPVASILLGIRDGLRDAKQGRPPYVIALLFAHEGRRETWKDSLKHTTIPMIVGIVLDLIVQWLIFRRAFFMPAVMVGTLLVGIPYMLSRGLTNRIARHYRDRTAMHGSSLPMGKAG